ncbi:MAG TPA: hypothetical protein G4O13_07845 [Dehalococcoidia bacterium]|nr:hypothetical protein [Dehalococcoidia bacterium]
MRKFWFSLALILTLLALGLTYSGCEQLVPGPGEDSIDAGWVAIYDGQIADDDGGQALAVDEEGNLYVTGYSWGDGTSSDYLTMKYSATGKELWVARYDGTANSEDWALDMARGSSGNVYVTGWSNGDGTKSDYATLKYDAAGKELWVARYDGLANGYDLAYGIALDYLENIYVTGWSQGQGAEVDYATVKYDSDGNQLWVTYYNGLSDGEDKGCAIAVGGWGNVYVTGWSQGSGIYSDYATIKYDSAGNQLWVARYDGPIGGEDEAQAVAVDTWGNVYITGWSQGNGTGEDYATVKYDTNGNQLWVARYDGPASGNDRALAMVLDDSANVYVTGWSQGNGTGEDYATVKYDTNGKRLWVARYDGPVHDEDIARDIDIDMWGNAYVTGWSRGNRVRYDYATVKYDVNGNHLWASRYDGPARGHDKAYAITVDARENIYVTGRGSGEETYYDYTTIKYVQ